jgi:hypothetical protein
MNVCIKPRLRPFLPDVKQIFAGILRMVQAEIGQNPSSAHQPTFPTLRASFDLRGTIRSFLPLLMLRLAGIATFALFSRDAASDHPVGGEIAGCDGPLPLDSPEDFGVCAHMNRINPPTQKVKGEYSRILYSSSPHGAGSGLYSTVPPGYPGR